VLSDLYKTEVYALAEWLNSSHYRREVIPNSILKKAPSAELRPDQKDSDSLPEYGVLDQLLKGYLEEGLEYEELVQRGLEKGMVKRILKLVDLNEFKRYQSAPGLKLSKIAFGMGRRRPLVQQWMRYRESMS
ncbi:MAG: NAD(+) synthase, partial [Bacteroidota bacterium]